MGEIQPVAVTHDRVAVVMEDGTGPLANEVRIGPHLLRADEPAGLGGEGKGPDPFEFLIAGLGVCTSMTLRLYANRKGWPLERISVRVRHAERLSQGAARDVFTREIELVGDLDDEARRRLLTIAERCPVSRTLTAGADIQTSLVA